MRPHHSLMCSGLLIASQTRSRDASNRRVIRISTSEGVVMEKLPLFAMWLPDMSLLLRFEFLQIGLETIQTLLPHRAIVFGPFGDFLDACGLQPARPPLRLPPTCDESRAFENTQMLRNGRHAHVKRLGQFGDGAFAVDESRENRAAGGIGQ